MSSLLSKVTVILVTENSGSVTALFLCVMVILRKSSDLYKMELALHLPAVKAQSISLFIISYHFTMAYKEELVFWMSRF